MGLRIIKKSCTVQRLSCRETAPATIILRHRATECTNALTHTAKKQKQLCSVKSSSILRITKNAIAHRHFVRSHLFAL
jgi:hypothetical protein